jgi:hypothetical protein
MTRCPALPLAQQDIPTHRVKDAALGWIRGFEKSPLLEGLFHGLLGTWEARYE